MSENVDIIEFIKFLRTERPTGILYANETKVCDVQVEMVEVLLREDRDFIHIKTTADGVTTGLDLEKCSAEFGEYTIHGLMVAIDDHRHGLRDITKSYKISGSGTAATHIVGEYFDVNDAFTTYEPEEAETDAE